MTLHTDVDVSRRDYDVPLRDDDDTDSLPAELGLTAPRADDDDEYADLFSRAADLIAEDFSVLVVPVQRDEFVCSRCFLVHHRSQLATAVDGRPVCLDCLD